MCRYTSVELELRTGLPTLRQAKIWIGSHAHPDPHQVGSPSPLCTLRTPPRPLCSGRGICCRSHTRSDILQHEPGTAPAPRRPSDPAGPCHAGGELAVGGRCCCMRPSPRDFVRSPRRCCPARANSATSRRSPASSRPPNAHGCIGGSSSANATILRPAPRRWTKRRDA